MDIKFRNGIINDLTDLKSLAIKSWEQFRPLLTNDNWEKLCASLTDENTYIELLDKSKSIVATDDKEKIIGMAFLVLKGNPTEIYDKDWSYIRFVTVDPDFGGKGIGRKLTNLCIEKAKKQGENIIALHTSEFMIKARNIYEHLGFKMIKEIEPRYGKRYWLYKMIL